MVNAEQIEKDLDDLGIKKGFLAKKCGMTIQTLNRKLSGKNDFTTAEVEIMCKELGYSTPKKLQSIFFAKEVDNMSTSNTA